MNKLATSLLLVVAACSAARTKPDPARTVVDDRVTARPAVEPTVLAAADEPSAYELGIDLRDAHGAVVPLDVDRGHPTLISMFYGNCATACPALIGYAKQIAAQTPDGTRILLVSFDAEHDTPARLSELTTAHELDTRWTLASASDADARALAAVLGTKYRASPNGQFFHNSVLVVLDADGRPVMRQNGLGDPSALVATLGRLDSR